MLKNTEDNNKNIHICDGMNRESMERVRQYTTFYRRNLDIFVKDYFKINLHPFQQDMIYQLGVSNNIMVVASRAVGKTWILGVGACAIATLYPHSEIVIVSKKIKQAGLIISEKIEKELCQHSNLKREIKDITASETAFSVDFHNGSTIKVVPALDSARGERATMIIFEEFRIIPKNIADTIIKPMSHPRQAPYKMLPKYVDIVKPEETRLCYISSSGYTHEWIADAIKTQITEAVNKNGRCFFAFDYFMALKHNLKTVVDIETARKDSDEISFLIEYCNILYGENANAFFTLEQLRRAQKIKEPFYPVKNDERMMGWECNSYSERETNKYGDDIRLISIDIATAGGKGNDNTCIHCIVGTPTATGYKRKYVYECVYSGTNPVTQCLYIRRIFKDFGADYVVFDLANNGHSFFGMLTQDIEDPDTGEFYQGWTIIEDDQIHVMSKDVLNGLREQVLSSNPLPIMFPISASADLNHLIAMDFRKQLNNNTIELLLDEADALVMLNKDKYFREQMGEHQKAWIISPFRSNSEFITEIIQLSSTWKGGKVSLKEPNGATKDRYSSGSYGNYFLSLKEIELLKDTKSTYSAKDYKDAMNRTRLLKKTIKVRDKYFG